MSKKHEFDDKKHVVFRVSLRNSVDDDAATKMLQRNRPNHLAAARGCHRTPDGGGVPAGFLSAQAIATCSTLAHGTVSI
jgi:hypothetical protein